MSYFAPRYGFVCDQVDNFEVVLASGKVVKANAGENPDLWFALKGGSNNFGVVTRFDLKTFSQGKIWGGTVVNPINTLPAQISAFSNFTNATNYDTSASIINTYGYLGSVGSWFVTNLLVYTKPEIDPAVLRPFTDIEPQIASTMRLTNLTDATSEEVKATPYGLRQLFLTRTYGNDPAFLTDVFNIANRTLETFKHTTGLVYNLVYQPLPTSITSHAANSGGNALGLNPADGPQVLALQTIQWANEADDELINNAARDIWVQADALAQRKGLMRKWIYLNYANQDQDPIGSYGEGNVEKLRAASRKFDPNGLFQRSVPGGFKLFGKNSGGTNTRNGVA
ncbi:MAG: hypothetical protein Q9179_004166 [Wetmoreana sp. 5 TL-2023]